jgi:hypothetical protein
MVDLTKNNTALAKNEPPSPILARSTERRITLLSGNHVGLPRKM